MRFRPGPVASGADYLSPFAAPGAVADGAGGFALVEAGRFAGFGPKARAVAGRAGDHPQATAFGAFLKRKSRSRGKRFPSNAEFAQPRRTRPSSRLRKAGDGERHWREKEEFPPRQIPGVPHGSHPR